MSEFRFLYWDDLGDSQEEVDNQNRELPAEAFCANHQREVDDSEKEEEQERRMMIIMRNGNSGEHYDIYDDGEIEDIEWTQEKKQSLCASGTEKLRLFKQNNAWPLMTFQTTGIK